MRTPDATATPVSTRATTKRQRERGRYEPSEIYTILDEALICHVAISDESGPCVLPTIHARIGDRLYLHGAASNHLLRAIAHGAEACVEATIVDDLVLARSAFHHSMNYRSVVLYGSGSAVTEREEKRAAVTAIVDHVLPGRSNDVRAPTTAELRSTIVVRIPIKEASAKVRTGPPIDDAEDLDLLIWSGVIPVRTVLSRGVASLDAPDGIEVPRYVMNPVRGPVPR